VFIANTNREENLPSHLTLKDMMMPVGINLATYVRPEARFWPAGVYEVVKDG
jgi:electron-transferring-flavoprotein dehydrogenase